MCSLQGCFPSLLKIQIPRLSLQFFYGTMSLKMARISPSLYHQGWIHIWPRVGLKVYFLKEVYKYMLFASIAILEDESKVTRNPKT